MLFSTDGKKVLELAADEVIAGKHRAVGPEHLLLAILRDESNVACEVLDVLGADARSLPRSVLASAPA